MVRQERARGARGARRTSSLADVTSPRAALRAVVYSAFYRMPHPVRVRIVRLLVHKYIVGAVVLMRDAEAPPPGRLLLLRQPPGKGWTLPAGLLRKREEPADGALRELAEETGITLPAADLHPAVPNAVVHAKGWVDMVFQASVPASTTKLTVDGAEVWEAAWHPLDDLPRLTLPTARLLGRYGIGPLADQADQATHPEQTDQAGHPQQTDQATHPEQTDHAGHPEQTDQAGHSEQTGETGRPDKTGEAGRAGQEEQASPGGRPGPAGQAG